MSDTTDTATYVDQVLARHALPVSAEERERLIRIQPMIAEWAAAVRAPAARYAEPAVIYPATFER